MNPTKKIQVAFAPPSKISPAVQHVRDTQDRQWGKDWRKKKPILVAAHFLGGDMVKFHYR